jgi:hypothetical protein
MNPWPFVIAAYLLVGGATAALVLRAWTSMRQAETRADAVRRPKG